MATGSSENTVAWSARPSRRRTHRPSLMSTAGMMVTRAPLALLDSIPAHVRNLPTGREPAHDAGQHVEALALAELLAAREEQLIAEADAEKRAAAVERATQRRRQVKTVEIGHRIVKRAVAGKDHGIGGVHRLGVLGHDGVHADPFEGLLDRAEIASAVIDDGDHSVPL